jgi:hypothetical protein
MPAKEILHLLGIAHHDPGDGGVGRFRDAQGDDVSVMSVEELHHIEHRADFVREKNGELFDEGSVNFRGGLWQIDRHEENGGRPGLVWAGGEGQYLIAPVFFANE